MAEGTEDEDRKHEPTQRKLDEAIKRGDVAKSIEINSLFILGGFTLVLMTAGGSIATTLTLDLRTFLSDAHRVPMDGAGLLPAIRYGVWAAFAALAIPLAAVAAAAIAGGGVQHRPLWTLTPLKPQLSRISPLSGFKRIFGREAFVQFVKGLAKIAIVGTVVILVLWSERDRFELFARLDERALLPALFSATLKLLGGVLAIFAFVAIGDAVYQRLTWMQRQRMSDYELKQEYKESEGNPEIKGRLRKLRAERVRRRMMAAVPDATVIVTNPTHYAVALKYEAGMAAPICVAKGVDALALRIRAVAAEHRVAIVENPPLARALHASVEIDEEIPVEHYKAVAEVIGYVLRLRLRPS